MASNGEPAWGGGNFSFNRVEGYSVWNVSRASIQEAGRIVKRSGVWMYPLTYICFFAIFVRSIFTIQFRNSGGGVQIGPRRWAKQWESSFSSASRSSRGAGPIEPTPRVSTASAAPGRRKRKESPFTPHPGTTTFPPCTECRRKTKEYRWTDRVWGASRGSPSPSKQPQKQRLSCKQRYSSGWSGSAAIMGGILQPRSRWTTDSVPWTSGSASAFLRKRSIARAAVNLDRGGDSHWAPPTRLSF